MANKEAYFDAKELAHYIAQKYEDKFKRKISKIKLQKSLYFLFAYWGGYVNKQASLDGYGEIEGNDANLFEHLFNNRIEAWVYGPVVPDVYNMNLDDAVEREKALAKINKASLEVVDFIDDLLNDLFSTSDFKLVDLSHEDKCWQDYFNEEDVQHKREIPKDKIIKEYAERI